jgi:hypothetical protein
MRFKKYFAKSTHLLKVERFRFKKRKSFQVSYLKKNK